MAQNTLMTLDLKAYLLLALKEAKLAGKAGNVPIGALIVSQNGEILSSGRNEIKTNFDITAHAEVVALRNARKKSMVKFNQEPTWLFTSLEPCFACSFFITRSNVKNVVWALNDPYAGGIDDLLKSKKLGDKIKNLRLIAEPDEECRKVSSLLMQDYYTKKGDTETAKIFM